jgi:hypothetical protein
MVCLALATPVAKTCDAGGGAFRSQWREWPGQDVFGSISSAWISLFPMFLPGALPDRVTQRRLRLEVELVDIVLVNRNGFPKTITFLSVSGPLAVMSSSDSTASRVPNRPAGTLACVALSLRVPARLA